MKNYLLDSDVVINFLKGRSKKGFDLCVLNALVVLHVSSMTVAEVWAGIPREKIEETRRVFSVLRKKQISSRLARSAGQLVYFYKSKGTIIDVSDAIIAQTAIENNLILASHDKIFTKIKEVKLYTPVIN